MKVSLAGIFLMFAFLVAGCGGGGNDGGGNSSWENQGPLRSQYEIFYQEWKLETRPGHQSLGIFVDPATGDLVAGEFQETPKRAPDGRTQILLSKLELLGGAGPPATRPNRKSATDCQGSVST